MAFAETNDLRGRSAKGSFLGDVLSVVGPMALGALGSVASEGLSSIGGSVMGSILGKGSEAVKAQGGAIPQMMNYQGGGTHEQNPLGGIPVDHLGNPSANPTALVEANEVGYKLPGDKTGYVFSDRIKLPGTKHTFASEAKKIASKYKNRLGKDLNKPDSLAKDAMDMEMSQLKEKQEQIKQMEQMQQMQAQALAFGGYLQSVLAGGGEVPLVVPEAANPAPSVGFPVRRDQVYDPTYAADLRYYPENASATRLAKYPYKNGGNDVLRRGNFSESPIYKAKYNEKLPVTPYSTDGKPVGSGGYSSVNDALTSVLNNDAIRDITIDRAVGDSLNKFLSPRGLAAIDSLNMANLSTGDTTGRHNAIEGIAKRFPDAVDPKRILDPETYRIWNDALGGKNQGIAHAGLYEKSPTASSLISNKNATKGTEETETDRGKTLWGMRNAANTNLNSYMSVGTPHGIGVYGNDVGYGPVLTVSTDYDLKDKEFSGRVTNISGNPDKFKSNSGRSAQYNPDQYFRNYGTPKKAYGGNLSRMSGINGDSQLPAKAPVTSDKDNFLKGAGYKESMWGNGIQALTRIPQLFTQPNSIRYDRVSPELVDYAQERGSMETSRNNQLGFLKRQASMAGNAGQALGYLSSAIPSAYNNYDQQYAQSIERQQNTNAQLMNQANAQNAQIQMREAEANAMEKDAARSIRDQAISDIGTIGAQGLQTKSKLLGQYNALKAQAMTTDNDIWWDKDGNFHSKLRRDPAEIIATPTRYNSFATQAQIDWNPYSNSLNMQPLNAALSLKGGVFGRPLTPELANMNLNNAVAVSTPPTLEEIQAQSNIVNGIPYNQLSELSPTVKAYGGNLKKRKGGYLKKKYKK